MEPEGSLPQSQVPTTCPYPKPDQLGCTKVSVQVQGLHFDYDNKSNVCQTHQLYLLCEVGYMFQSL